MARQIRYVPINSVKLHPSADLIPDMKPSEWDDFYLDISNHDIKVPLEITADGIILDGRHRYKAASMLGMKRVPVIDAPLNGDSPDDYMIKAAVLRRHLTDDQRAAIATLWKRENKQKPGENQIKDEDGRFAQRRANRINTRQAAAQQFQTPRRKIDEATKLQNNNPDLFDKVHKGDLSLRDAKTVAALNSDDQKEVLDLVDKKEAKNVITARRIVQRENASKIKPPTGKYQLIYADPPWEYEFGLDIHGAASRHYNTMTIEELCNLPIKEIANDDSVLFIWVTSPKLEQVFTIIKAWGFEYKTSFVWDKVKHVMGHYNSIRHEFLLVATKGVYPKQSNTLHDSVIQSERNGHSEKPEIFREIINGMYPHAEKIELFGYKDVSGWSVWGGKT